MKSIELIYQDTENYFMREAFNTLRTNVLFCGTEFKKILVTSCVAHEGKTTVSLELARSLAEIGKKVLLIDADLRKSVTVTRYTKESGVCGLSQYLSGQANLDDALYQTQYPGFDIIFAGPFPPNPTELVGNQTFRSLLDTAAEKYDYVLIDAPPLGMVIDAAVMSEFCDGALLVINRGTVKYRMAQNVAGQLQKSGCKLLGVVLNQPAGGRRSKTTDQYQYQYKYKY